MTSESGWRPATLGDALAALSEEAAVAADAPTDAAVETTRPQAPLRPPLARAVGLTPVAGGTDLMVQHRSGAGIAVTFGTPPLFISRLPELRHLRSENGFWHIGAAVTLSELGQSTVCPQSVREILKWFASPAVRNVATVGGNVCNASPAADLLPWLYANDAVVVLASAGGERELPVRAFIPGPGRTVRRPDELLTEIRVRLSDEGAVPGPPSAGHQPEFRLYRKVAPRRSNALAKLSLYVEASRTGDGTLERVAIAIGAVAPTVVRVPDAEGMLAGASAFDLRPHRSESSGASASERLPDGSGSASTSDPGPWDRSPLVRDVLAMYEEHIQPIDDQRSTAGYRRRTSLRLLEDVLGRHLPEYLENP